MSATDYSEEFYESQMDGSYRSARIYAAHMAQLFRPRSVADVGCGRGTWLKAFKEVGTELAVGFDGNWNSQENMVDQSIMFVGADLNMPIAKQSNRFDLALSLEVAEHLKESSARTFVESLTMLADAVMFGAAYLGQGGTNHINEQPHTYWASMFGEFEYRPYDFFRPVFWGNAEVEFWYQQNTFLYVKCGSELAVRLDTAGHQPMRNVAFMNCVHPALYRSKISQATAKSVFAQWLRRTIPKPMLPLGRRIKRALS